LEIVVLLVSVVSTGIGVPRLQVNSHAAQVHVPRKFQKLFDAQQKGHRAMPPPRVVVSHDHLQAVRKHYFGPEEIERLVAAYDQTLRALGLKDPSDPITQPTSG